MPNWCNYLPVRAKPKSDRLLDEKHLLGIDIWRKIIVWDFETGQGLDTKTVSADPYVFTAELSPNKKILAFGKEDSILLFEFKLPHQNSVNEKGLQEKMQ